MEDLSCPVCLNEFHERDFVPKVLDCSHNFCASCVQELLNSSQVCPLCRKKMERTEYPTNVMGLKWVDFCNKSSNDPTSSHSSLKTVGEYEEMIVKVKRKIEVVRGDINDLEKERKGLDERIEIKQKLSQSLESDLVKLEQMQEKWKQFDDEETKNVVRRLNALCHSVAQDLLKLEDFGDEAALKREVAHRAQGGSIFGFKDVKEERRYGKLTLLYGCLWSHSLSRFEEGVGEGTTLVQFEDIAPSRYQGVDSFLLLQSGPDGPQIRINIRLQPLDPQTSQFAHLCSGERGPSYKGAEVRDKRGEYCGWWSYFFAVAKYMEDGREGRGAIEAASGGSGGKRFKQGEVVIQGLQDGSFKMVKGKVPFTLRVAGVVGVVTSPSVSALDSFPWEKEVRVKDCGICLPF